MESEKEKVSKIKEYWDGQAEKYGADVSATMPDALLKDLEVRTICDHLGRSKNLLDVGCGNGYSTIKFAKAFQFLRVQGVDYSEKMIEAANRTLKSEHKELKARVSFAVGDITDLKLKPGSFDTITTDRCLINLPNPQSQLLALANVHRVLQAGGIYLMCEDTIQGLSRINEMRKSCSLSTIPMRWHNQYIDEQAFLPVAKKLFEVIEINNFSSLYYIASRIFNAKLSEMEGKEPSYNHPLNRIAVDLPSVGDYGPLKLFVLKKKRG